jgi:AcrR family transcriptional regulator
LVAHAARRPAYEHGDVPVPPPRYTSRVTVSIEKCVPGDCTGELVTNTAAGGRRTRRRGAALEEQILLAAWGELQESGWARFSMERVAGRAGTGKTSVYARWPHRLALVMAAARHMAADPGDLEVTPDLRTNLVAALDAVSEAMSGPFGEVARGWVSEAPLHPEMRGTIGAELGAAPVQMILTIVTHAIQDGQAGPQALDGRIVNLGPALVAHHFFVTGSVPDRTTIEGFVDTIWMPLMSAVCHS